MFATFHRKVIAAFILVITLVTVIGLGLSIVFTTTRFNVLVTEQNRQQARELAPLLEARYAFLGNWRELDPHSNVAEDTSTPAPNFWQRQADWPAAIRQALQLPDSTTAGISTEERGWRQVAEQLQVAPDVLVTAILHAERIEVENALLAGELDPVLYAPILAQVEQEATAYVFGQTGNAVPWQNGGSWLVDVLHQTSGRVLVTDAAGQVIYDSAGARLGTVLSQETLATGVPLWDRRQIPAQPLGAVIVAVDPAAYTVHQTAFLRSVRYALLAASLLAGAVALLSGYGLARQLLQPIARLVQTTHSLTRGIYVTALPAQRNDEFGRLNAAFHQLVVELSTQRDLRRQLVNDIAHDLKTPLSVIRLEMEAVHYGMQTPAEALAQVEKEVCMLDDLVQDLIWLADTDSGQIVIEPAPTDLAALAAEAVERWQARAQSAELRLRFVAPPPLPMVAADGRRLHQALGNLLANAVAYTPAGGEIVVTLAPSAHPQETGSAERYIVVRVSNTGPGIAAADLPHIFDRFYRGDRSRSRHSGGRGLGLAIVHRIVELHGGWVWAESEVDCRTTLAFGLPVGNTAYDHEQKDA